MCFWVIFWFWAVFVPPVIPFIRQGQGFPLESRPFQVLEACLCPENPPNRGFLLPQLKVYNLCNFANVLWPKFLLHTAVNEHFLRVPFMWSVIGAIDFPVKCDLGFSLFMTHDFFHVDGSAIFYVTHGTRVEIKVIIILWRLWRLKE